MKYDILIVLVCTMLGTVNCSKLVRMFPKNNFQGESFKVNMSYANPECINLPSKFRNTISSVNTGDLCLELYSAVDCGGQKIIVYPGTGHFDLLFWRFDDKTVSTKVCDEHIDHKTDAKRKTILFNPSRHTRNLNTMEYNLNVEYCENIPKNYTVDSIDEYKICFKYFSIENCQGEPLKFKKNKHGKIKTQSGLNSIVSVGRCTTNGPNMTFTTTVNPLTANSTNPYPTNTNTTPKAMNSNSSTNLNNSNSSTDASPSNKKLFRENPKGERFSTVGVGLCVLLMVFVTVSAISAYIYKKRFVDKPTSASLLEEEEA